MPVSAKEAEALGKGGENDQQVDKEIVQAGSSDPTAQSIQDKVAEGTNTGSNANPGNIVVPGMKISQTKPVAQTDLGHAWDTSNVKPGSMAFHMATMMMSPQFAAMSQRLGPMGAFAFAAPAITADAHQGVMSSGSTELQSPQQSAGDLAGNVTWDAAQQNDSTKAINPRQLPAENAAHKVQRGIYSTLGGLFDMNLSAADMGKRMDEENRTGALNALTNIQMVREQQMLHKGQEEFRNEAAKVGAGQFEFLRTAPDAKVIGEGLTSDQIQQGLQGQNNPNGVYNPHTMQIFQTGRVQVGTDKTGNPMYRSTYSVLMPGGPITMGLNKAEESGNALEGAKLSPEQREAAKRQEDNLKFINANVPGSHIKPGQTLSSADWGALMQQANNGARIHEVVTEVNKRQDKEAKMAEWNERDQTFAQNREVTKALNNNRLNADDVWYAQKAYDQLDAATMKTNSDGTPTAEAQRLKQELGPDWRNQWAYTVGNHDPDKWNAMLNAYHAAKAKSTDELNLMITDPKEIAKDPAAAKALTVIPIANATAQIKASQGIVDDRTKWLADPANKDADPEVRAQKQQQLDQEMQKGEAAKERLDKLQNVYNAAENVGKAKIEEKKEEAESKTGYIGDPNATSPQAFLKSLTPGEQELVKAIGTGHVTADRMEYLAARQPQVLEAVMRAYPGFDSSKAAAYKKETAKFYTGKVADQLTAGSIALRHLLRLKQINDDTPLRDRVPGTEAYKRYENLLSTVADELVTFYGEPKTNEVIAAKKSTLGGMFNREGAIEEQAQAMGVRFETYENEWDEAAPSPIYHAPMPKVSEKSRQARAILDSSYGKEHPELLKKAGKGTNLALESEQKQEAAGELPQQKAPEGAKKGIRPAPAADGTPVYMMEDGSLQDAQGNQYDKRTGKKL